MEPFTVGALIAGGTALLGGYMNNQANASAVSAANAQSAANTSATNAAAAANQASANASNERAVAATNAANLQSVHDQMSFQERMSSTAYQRATDDMRKAGINPMLAYMQGGASSPGGASANLESPKFGAPQVSTPEVRAAHFNDILSPAVATAMQASSVANTIDFNKADIANREANTKINKANSVADVGYKAAQTAYATQSAKNAMVQEKILNAQAKRAGLEGDWYDSDTGRQLWKMNKINETMGGVLDSANSAKDLVNPFKIFDVFKKQRRKSGHFGTLKDGTIYKKDGGEIIYEPKP